MVVYRKLFVRIGDVFFDECPARTTVDILRVHQANSPIDAQGCTPFFTILLDLNRSEEELFRSLKKGTRYEVRRAIEKDGFIAQSWFPCTPGKIQEFASFYDRFAHSKRLPQTNRRRLKAFGESPALWLSCAGQDGEALVWHAYVLVSGRVRLLYSASMHRCATDTALRQVIGRANRYLHWKDICAFKGHGLHTLDFGGWYEGGDDADRLRINAFKEEFGGTIVKNYNYSIGLTLPGKITLSVKRAWERLNA